VFAPFRPSEYSSFSSVFRLLPGLFLTRRYLFPFSTAHGGRRQGRPAKNGLPEFRSALRRHAVRQPASRYRAAR
jgi:hypothetical protein